jgi:hypothetical protein
MRDGLCPWLPGEHCFRQTTKKKKRPKKQQCHVTCDWFVSRTIKLFLCVWMCQVRRKQRIEREVPGKVSPSENAYSDEQ